MKHFNSIIKSTSKITFAIVTIAFLYGCNVKEVLTDASGQNRSFILFNPNFLTTNYQVRLFDTANNFIEEEMTVEVFSNKKIVDEEGYYKTTFTTKNGLLNFAIDPNEVISESDPIKFSIKVTSNNNVYFPGIINEFVGKNSFDRIFKMIIKNNDIDNSTALVKASASNTSNNIKMIHANDDNKTYELFKIGGIEVPIYANSSSAAILPKSISNVTTFYTKNKEYSENYSESTIFPITKEYLDNNISLNLTYRNVVDLNTMDYTYYVAYYDAAENYTRLEVYKNGDVYYSYSDSKWNFTFGKLPVNPNWNGTIMIPKGSIIHYISIFSTRTNTELKDCPSGFNVKFNNIAKGTNPEIEYGTYRNDQASGKTFISSIGIAKVNEAYSTYNTGEILYSNIKNKVVFSENSQYKIIPSSFEITGTGACGSTTIVDIIPKENLSLYKLTVKTQCEKDNFGIVANSNIMFRKKGTTNWEGLTIENGIGNLYLENNSVYEVRGNIGKSAFEFNFTNDQKLFESQKLESLSKNKDLNNIIYTLSTETAGNKLLNIELFFAQNACPY